MKRKLMMLVGCGLWLALSLIIQPAAVQAADDKAKTTNDPAQVDDDFAFQGEYVGKAGKGDDAHTWGVQVIALGDGKFEAVGYPGGLPGDGWNKEEKKSATGAKEGDQVVLTSPEKVTLTIKDGVLTLTSPEGDKLGDFAKVQRESETLGAKPPEGAVVLFDGSSADNFENGRMTEDGLLMEGVTSKQKFQDMHVHIEFRLPYMPKARGQGRGNSGCYFQGRYEVQMLDSFGLNGEDNECGGIYKIAKPEVNMCYPPLAWQTYDVDFTAAKYEDGKKVKNAMITVKHNGVVIHKDVELPNSTTASPLKDGPEPGPIFLQNHGNPVRYRNIWVVEK